MNRTAFIIGASSGIGYETAKTLINFGYKVYNGSRTPCNIASVINLTVDVTSNKSIETAFDYILNDSKRIDVFVYSAGYSMASPVEYALEEDYKYLFEVNYFGAVACLKRLIPIMRAQNDGRIILISSVGGKLPIAYDSFYSSSKAALDMLAKELRYELSPFNVKVYNILPGGTATPFTFRRNVYPTDKVGVYARKMKRATSSLANMEQGGMEPKSVAKTIYKSIDRKNPPPLIAAGFKNKAIVAMNKILPVKLTLKLNAKKYHQK